MGPVTEPFQATREVQRNEFGGRQPKQAPVAEQERPGNE